jgi:hypothetical protein
MSEAHTAAQGAMRILEVFREHRTPVETDFMADSMRLAFQNGVFTTAEFEPAVQLAISNGWIVDMGSSYRLTQTGYEISNR